MKARLLLPILFGTLFAFPANAGTYSSLDPGYVQAVYAVSSAPLTSFTFAPNGDIWAVQNSPGALIRFDSHSTQSVHGTQVHPISQSAPTAGFWGVTSHPDGRLYLVSNSLGIADMSTGSLLSTDNFCSSLQLAGLQLAACPVPPYHLALVGNNGFLDFDPVSLSCVDVGAGTNSDVSYDVNGDAAVFHTYTGALCCPPRTYTINTLTGLGPNLQSLGLGVMSMSFSSIATGVAVLDGMHQVIAVFEDGTVLDVDLPGKTQRVFASGGFPNAYGTPGGLVRKGPDGALYVLQAGTHYDDGTVTSDFSIVRISQKVVATESTTWGRIKGAYR